MADVIMNCGKCGAVYEDDSKACPGCGEKYDWVFSKPEFIGKYQPASEIKIIPAPEKAIDISHWMIHECHGTCERTFRFGGYIEIWTLCAECGNWWMSGLVNLAALAKIKFKDEGDQS